MIRYVKGNIVNAPEEMILHGCNAQGKMNSGVAKAIRDKWPNVFFDYQVEHELNGLQLGKIYPCFVRDPTNNVTRIVVNAITQQYYGREFGRVYVDYKAIEHTFRDTGRLMDRLSLPDLAIPRVGAGLGGGDWTIIEDIIDKAIPDRNIWVYDL